MAFCSNCGKELDDAKFCSECGRRTDVLPVGDDEGGNEFSAPANNSNLIYEGEVHKCPACGNPLGIYDLVCGFCGYEIRGRHISTTIRLFTDSLREAKSDEERARLISEFPVPNNREDILEFIILASANISSETTRQVFYAWVTKFEHCYEKSKLLPLKEEEHNHIEHIYRKTAWQITFGKMLYACAVPLRSILNVLRKVPKIVYIVIFALLLYALIPEVQDAVSPIFLILKYVMLFAIIVVIYIVIKGNLLDSLIAKIENILGVGKSESSAAFRYPHAHRTQESSPTQQYTTPPLKSIQQPENHQPRQYVQPRYRNADVPSYNNYSYQQPCAPYSVPHGKWKKKWVSLILCLFFGYLGAHRFYEGKYITGVIYLLSMGLLGFGILIDIIILLGKPNQYIVQ